MHLRSSTDITGKLSQTTPHGYIQDFVLTYRRIVCKFPKYLNFVKQREFSIRNALKTQSFPANNASG